MNSQPRPLLYHVTGSPPAHATRLVAAHIGLQLDLTTVDTIAGEQLRPAFVAINPQHTVPTLVDTDGRVLWDSHAISAYLIGKYGGHRDGDHPLYPADLYTRARIQQRLHFDSSQVFPAVRKFIGSQMRNCDQRTAEALADVHAVYATLEQFLASDTHLVGNSLTLADLSIISLVWTSQMFVPIDAFRYPKTAAWVRRISQVRGFQETVASGAAEGLMKINAVIAASRRAMTAKNE